MCAAPSTGGGCGGGGGDGGGRRRHLWPPSWAPSPAPSRRRRRPPGRSPAPARRRPVPKETTISGFHSFLDYTEVVDAIGALADGVIEAYLCIGRALIRI